MENARLPHDIYAVGQCTASEVSRFLRSEFGLRAASSRADWAGDSLTITVAETLTPVGQAAAQTFGGDSLLETAYEGLYRLHQSRLEALISQAAGRTVRRSALEMDADTGCFSLTFFFASH